MVFAPTAFAGLTAIVDDGVPVAICLGLISGCNLEREGLAVLECRPAIDAETGNSKYREFDGQDVSLFARWVVARSPLDFIAKLAALVPKPRVNLIRFHGVFAPNSKYRVEVTPAKRGKGRIHQENEDKTPEQRHQAMTWAQRLTNSTGLNLNGFSQPRRGEPQGWGE